MEEQISKPSHCSSPSISKGQFEIDCESMADNLNDDFLESWHNRHKRPSNCGSMVGYIWTDERLQLLVTTFYDYVTNPDIDSITCSGNEKHLLLLGKLRTALLTLATDVELPGSPSVDDIKDELNDFAVMFHKKYPRYYEFKERLGDTIKKKFRLLLRHKRFDDYVEIGATPHRILHPPSVALSKSSSCYFYWTDKRLQHLVNSYYMLLEDAKSDSRGTSEKCLTILKGKLSWNVTVPDLTKKLNTIFENYEKNIASAYKEFRIRIGKDACIYFDRLVRLEWGLYKKKNTPYSKSGGSSSGRKSSASLMSSANFMSMEDQRNANAKDELMSSGVALDDRQIAIALFKLADDNMRSFFLACSADERKYFVEQLIK